jgi:hypothetical protein
MPPRGQILLRAGIGAALITFPGRVASVVEGHPAGLPARIFTWVLGMRQLTQAVLTAAAPKLLTPFRGAVIDGLHSVTTVLLATVSPRHRRAALMSAALAATLCALDVVRAGERRDRRPSPASTVVLAVLVVGLSVASAPGWRAAVPRRDGEPRHDNCSLQRRAP